MESFFCENNYLFLSLNMDKYEALINKYIIVLQFPIREKSSKSEGIITIKD